MAVKRGGPPGTACIQGVRKWTEGRSGVSRSCGGLLGDSRASASLLSHWEVRRSLGELRAGSRSNGRHHLPRRRNLPAIKPRQGESRGLSIGERCCQDSLSLTPPSAGSSRSLRRRRRGARGGDRAESPPPSSSPSRPLSAYGSAERARQPASTTSGWSRCEPSESPHRAVRRRSDGGQRWPGGGIRPLRYPALGLAALPASAP